MNAQSTGYKLNDKGRHLAWAFEDLLVGDGISHLSIAQAEALEAKSGTPFQELVVAGWYEWSIDSGCYIEAEASPTLLLHTLLDFEPATVYEIAYSASVELDMDPETLLYEAVSAIRAALAINAVEEGEIPKERLMTMPVRDLKTATVYPSKTEAAEAVAVEYGLDPGDRFAWLKIISRDPSRFVNA